MGLCLSRSFGTPAHLDLSSVSLFDLEARFFAPTRTSLTPARAEAVKVGRRTDLTACPAVASHTLTASSTTARLVRSGWRSEGSSLSGADQSRHNLVSGGPEDPNDLRLCKFFGLSEGYFLRLQNAYETLEAKRRIAAQLAKIKPYKPEKAA